jgi:hypothetical protein
MILLKVNKHTKRHSREKPDMSEIAGSDPHAFTECGCSSFDPGYVIGKSTNEQHLVRLMSKYRKRRWPGKCDL